MEKACKKCGVPQPLEAFYRDRKRSDGRRNTCIECDKVRKRSPEVVAQSKRYYHSAKGKAAEKRYTQSDKFKETRKRYASIPEVAEKIKERSRTAGLKYSRTQKGKETILTYRSRPEVQARRRDYISEYYSTLSGEKRERYLARSRRAVQEREARKKSLPATLTEEDWQRALDHFGHRCAYCGREGRLAQEHFVPLTLGGPYTPDNIVPSCKPCNTRKRNHLPEEWCSVETYDRILQYFRTLSG